MMLEAGVVPTGEAYTPVLDADRVVVIQSIADQHGFEFIRLEAGPYIVRFSLYEAMQIGGRIQVIASKRLDYLRRKRSEVGSQPDASDPAETDASSVPQRDGQGVVA